MSIQNQIDRIEQNVKNTYAVLSAFGADLPTEQNSDNLAQTAGTAKVVLYSEQSLGDEQKAQARDNIGAQPKGNYALKSEIPNVPVQSVNGKTGAVQLSASDVGALPSTYTPPNQTAEQVGADPAGTAAGAVAGHNTDTDSHADLRLELKALTDRLNAFFDSDNQTLDELSEIVAYITSNKALIDSFTTSKVSVVDIINNLTTNVVNKPLSAAQGVVLKSLVDGLQSGKLDASALTAAINTALAQAKASGEFDGAAGKDGLDATPVAPLFANSIEECTDTSKFYVLPDGFIYAYMPSAGPSYTNLAGNVTYDRRLSSSGKASSSAMSGAAYTDFIPVKKGQIVRIENFDIYSDFSSSAFPYVCFYTGASENNVVSSTPYVRPADLKTEFSGVTNSVNGDLVTWTAFKIAGGAQHSLADSITHIRISGKYFADKEIIVTVDEEITEGGSGGYAWQSTGHAFVPADYEAEILALQKNKADKTAIPTKLPNPNALTIDGVPYDGSTAVNIETQSGGNILYGKKWVACGDSFTHGGYNASDGFDSSVYVYQDGRFAGQNIVYPYIIGLRNNMNIVNLATGGQTMAQSSNSFMTRYANIDADADYITIMLGINDKLQNIPVGNLDDAVNTTFCGAFNIAMEHILENHPFAHIGIMVSNGTNEEIMEATRGIAERWGVPYLDYGSPQVPLMNRYTGKWESEGGKVCTKAREIREKNFCVISDGTNATNSHPNTAAHEYESTFIEAWLRML